MASWILSNRGYCFITESVWRSSGSCWNSQARGPFTIQKSHVKDRDQSTRLCKDLKLFCCQQEAREWGHPPAQLSSTAEALRGRVRARQPPSNCLPAHPEGVGVQDSWVCSVRTVVQRLVKVQVTKAQKQIKSKIPWISLGRGRGTSL